MIKILVPVDFSKASINALNYAIQLFGDKPLQIALLNTYGVKSSALLMKNIDDVLERESREEMDKLVDKMESDHPDIAFKSEIHHNDAVAAITKEGNTGKYDFVIMGTSGASGMKEVFMGSVAGGVVQDCQAPVIVVPHDYEFSAPKNLVLALSDHPFSEASVVNPLRKIQQKVDSKLTVLHISKDSSDEFDAALSEIQDMNPAVEFSFGTGDVNEDLKEYLHNNSSDLLCLIRAKKSFMYRLLNESVTMKQTFSSPVPLLILHDY